MESPAASATPTPDPVAFMYPDYPSGVCVYCGQVATDRDHLLPRNFTGDAVRRYVPVVPSCKECNCTLSDVFLPDVMDRRELVHRRYRIKYRRRLTMLVRTEEGLDEFGPTLQRAIRKMQMEHDSIMARLSWPEDCNYDADAWSHAWRKDG